MKIIKLNHLAVVVFAAAVVSGCGAENKRRLALEQSVERMKQGALIEEVEQKRRENVEALGEDAQNLLIDQKLEYFSSSDESSALEVNFLALPDDGNDPSQPVESMSPNLASVCDSVPSPVAGEDDEVAFAEAAIPLVACLHEYVKGQKELERAFDHTRKYLLPAEQEKLSNLNSVGLTSFFKNSVLANMNDLYLLLFSGISSEVKSLLRNQFVDTDLEELADIAKKRDEAAAYATKEFLKILEARKDLLEFLAEKSSRFQIMSMMLATKDDETGKSFAEQLRMGLGRFLPVPRDLDKFPNQVLRDHILAMIAPQTGNELSHLSIRDGNPFMNTLELLGDFAGPESSREARVNIYKLMRDQDNPATQPLEEAEVPRVKVAFIDSGYDFASHPDLALYMSHGTKEMIGKKFVSRDFVERDGNAWLPQLGRMAHGTGTMATFLTVLSKYSPQALVNDRIQLAGWKVDSIRFLLGGLNASLIANWLPRSPISGLLDAVEEHVENPAIAPDVVSMSMGFYASIVLQRAGKLDLIKRTPWLWVIAAGNEGRPLATRPMSCFGDLTTENRPTERLLCVGALVKDGKSKDGEEDTTLIAGYSNYGSGVDVYTYETFNELCPSGTSCSTPAISAMAAAVKASYPELSPEDVKQAIVSAATEKELEVEKMIGTSARTKQGGDVKRKVRVIDPETDLPKVLEKAKALSEARLIVAGREEAPARRRVSL